MTSISRKKDKKGCKSTNFGHNEHFGCGMYSYNFVGLTSMDLDRKKGELQYKTLMISANYWRNFRALIYKKDGVFAPTKNGQTTKKCKNRATKVTKFREQKIEICPLISRRFVLKNGQKSVENPVQKV